jgi:hypothetical protein
VIVDQLHNQAGAFVGVFRGSVVAVCDLDASNRLDQIGTATLFEVGQRRFAVSAEHVFKRLATRTLALANEGLSEIAHQQYFYTVPVGSQEDPFDISFVELSAEQVNDLGRCRFLHPSECDLHHRPDVRRPYGTKYYVLGFPCSLQKLAPRGERYQPVAMVVQTLPAPFDKYRKLVVQPENHLLLDFDRKDASGVTGPRTSPQLNGMSGCGIWTAPRDFTESPVTQRLVGILIEYHAQSIKAVVGTRVAAVFDGIARFFPEARAHLL